MPESLLGTWQVVFRVENKRGVGPYRNAKVVENIIGHHDSDNEHPTPYHDKGIERGAELGKEKCGFLSLEDLTNWFSSMDLYDLEKEGYTIAPVKGLITAIGQKQVLFKTK